MRTFLSGTAALSAAVLTTLGLAGGLTVGLAGTASAAELRVTDPADSSHGSDLRAVVVKNNHRSVVVTTRHTNLRPAWSTGSAGAVYLDTDPQHRGPEFVFVGGYFDGTDYQLLHTDGFGHRHWGKPAEGSYRMTLDYDRDRVWMRMSRAALDHPGKVRVAVRSSGTRTDGSTVVDWLGEPRSFTTWVARG